MDQLYIEPADLFARRPYSFVTLCDSQPESKPVSQTDRSVSDTDSLKASKLNNTTCMWFAVSIFRSLSGCSLFVRVEVVLRGATFHVLFTDASQLPPPFRIDNLSEVCIFSDRFIPTACNKSK